MARDDLPPLPDYLVTILMREPHNLSVHMAKRLARSPSELSFYNSVMEMGKSIEGSRLCNWYELCSPLIQACVSACAIVTSTRDYSGGKSLYHRAYDGTFGPP